MIHSYFQSQQRSAGHSPIYKVHKYFARRPHNQFRSIIEFYVPENGIVLDCFAGGGVSLIEGLSANRRVISIDFNEIASLVQLFEVSDLTSNAVNNAFDMLTAECPTEVVDWFRSTCRACGDNADVRWFERAYRVACPYCCSETLLDNESRAQKSDGRIKTGRYRCSVCQQEFRSVDTPRVGSKIIKMRVRCQSCGFHKTCCPSESDLERDNEISLDEIKIARDLGVEIPNDLIPESWDRQVEDALIRKGFLRFSDLFTSRNRLILGLLLKIYDEKSDDLGPTRTALAALGLISSLIRYVNNMTFCTDGWMDGRPVAWAKHAFWTPNQFVEVNPFEYLMHRAEAFRRADKDRTNRGINNRKRGTAREVLDGHADYAITRGDSREIPLPDECIDAVVTDPPFGSNVQYGELTRLWSVWIRERNPFVTDLFDLKSEILVNRKKQTDSKTLFDYENGLTSVFRECYRILRQDGVLTFTFNNSDSRAWYAVMRSAILSGFKIESKGVTYLEEIVAYRDTAHLRFDENIQGDVLYSFIKSKSLIGIQPSVDWLRNTTQRLAAEKIPQESHLYQVEVHLATIREAAARIAHNASYEEVQDVFGAASGERR